MKIYTKLSDPGLIAQLKDGAVGVLPTDTVYGLVAQAADEAAVARLYTLKNRDNNKLGTIIAANVKQLEELGLKHRYLTAVEHFWPGAISVIIPTGPALPYLHRGKYSLAVRIPEPQALRDLLAKTGPLLTTSANHSNKPPANNLKEAQAYFDDHVDFYVDGGELTNHQPSTIIRMIDDAIEIVRPGAVTIDENGRITT